MLLDDIKELHSSKWGPLIRPEVAKRMKAVAHQARAYVFDRDASLKLGRFIRECPDVIAKQIEFAIEPYPTTYIEVEIDAVIDGTGRAGSAAGPKADWKVGFLTHGNITNTLVCNRAIVGTLAGAYGFARSKQVDPYNDDELAREAIHQLGGSYNDLTPAQHRMFTDNFDTLFFGDRSIEDLTSREVMEGHQGELRVYIAALLLLHQKKGISLTERSAHRAMYRGKSRPFMAHHVVTITLDGPVEIRRALTAGTGETRRAHEVPAHYAHRYGTRNCEHVWNKRENEEHHWDCPKCGRFRYLRRDHIRGDASKGFVKKSYEVTTL